MILTHILLVLIIMLLVWISYVLYTVHVKVLRILYIAEMGEQPLEHEILKSQERFDRSLKELDEAVDGTFKNRKFGPPV